MNNKYITLKPKVGDRVKFYIDVPEQNIGTTGKAVYGEVIKLNRTTFTVEEDRTGTTHRVAKEWYIGATYLPKIVNTKK